MTYNHCQRSWAFFSFPKQTQLQIAKILRGRVSVTSARAHGENPQLLVGCQPRYLRDYRNMSTSVGGQENGWPSIPSTKFTPRLLTAQAVLALNTGVTSTRAFWNINCLCSLKATLLCPGNTVPIDRVFLWIFLPQQECKSCALLPYFSYPVHKRTAVRLIWLEFTVQCVCTTALSSAHFPLPIFFVIQNHLCYYRQNWYLLLQHHHLH